MFKRISLVVALAAMASMAFVTNALAAANTDAVDAVTSTTSTLKDTIAAAIPLILGVVAIIVVLGLAKRLLKKAG